jgi:phosphohistidine phosphatase
MKGWYASAMPLHRLILMRHGKAEARAPSGEDIDRALTQRGKEDSKAVAERLFREELIPDLVLCSTALRCEETWEAARPVFPPRVKVEHMRQLYNAGPDMLLETARDCGAESVMVIAHNPGLHILAAELLALAEGDEGRARAARHGFAPASAAAFFVDGPTVVCEALLSPKDPA